MAEDWRREDLRAANIYWAGVGLPPGALRAQTDLIPFPVAEREYLYPVRSEHESLDERMLVDLLRRVQELEHQVGAQQEVVRSLVTWRMTFRAFKALPGASGAAAGAGGGDPSQGQDEPQTGPGVLPDFLT